MKKHRKQRVYADGQKQYVDVPVDGELYKADNHAEYQRARSKRKDATLHDDIFADVSADVVEDFEEKQLLECLHEALQKLNEKERQLIDYLYFDGLTERQTAEMLGISQPAVTKRKHKIIAKLRDSLIDWI